MRRRSGNRGSRCGGGRGDTGNAGILYLECLAPVEFIDYRQVASNA